MTATPTAFCGCMHLAPPLSVKSGPGSDPVSTPLPGLPRRTRLYTTGDLKFAGHEERDLLLSVTWEGLVRS